MVVVGARLGHGQERWISIDGLIEWMMGWVERRDVSITVHYRLIFVLIELSALFDR